MYETLSVEKLLSRDTMNENIYSFVWIITLKELFTDIVKTNRNSYNGI